jgi:hypothetical protein
VQGTVCACADGLANVPGFDPREYRRSTRRELSVPAGFVPQAIADTVVSQQASQPNTAVTAFCNQSRNQPRLWGSYEAVHREAAWHEKGPQHTRLQWSVSSFSFMPNKLFKLLLYFPYIWIISCSYTSTLQVRMSEWQIKKHRDQYFTTVDRPAVCVLKRSRLR